MADNCLMVQSISPSGKLEAFVEMTDDVAYFYLRDMKGGQPLRSCWIRNFVPSSSELDLDRMKDGRSPLLPANYALFPEGKPVLHDGDLSVVWFEEENGASLLENDTVLCVIPPNSGKDGFEGYAAECTTKSVLCWPLADEKDVLRRVERDQSFWSSWEGAESTPFDELKGSIGVECAKVLGAEPAVFSIDQGEWPPKGLAKTATADGTYLMTIGGAVRRQPGSGDDPNSAAHRFELIGCTPSNAEDAVGDTLVNFMIALMEYPWNRDSSLVDGELVRFPDFVGACEDVAGAILLKEYPKAPRLDLGNLGGEPVEVYWIIPITESEWAYAETHGAIELTSKLVEKGVGHIVSPRPPAV